MPYSQEPCRGQSHGVWLGQPQICFKFRSTHCAVPSPGPNDFTVHLASDTSKSPKWNPETVSTLLLAGADVSHVDNEKSTGRRRNVLHFAAALGHTMLAQAVLNHVEANKRTIYANNATNRRKTALHLAAQHGHTDIVRLLLNQNAEIDARSEGDWTPLLIASKAGHDKTVEALLSATKPANVNARTSTGATSLHVSLL